jgi:hypothetical protein
MKLYIVGLKRSISSLPFSPRIILVFSACKNISCLNFSISKSKIHLAEFSSLNSDPPCLLTCGCMLEVSREAATAGEEHIVNCTAEQSKYFSMCKVFLGSCGD